MGIKIYGKPGMKNALFSFAGKVKDKFTTIWKNPAKTVPGEEAMSLAEKLKIHRAKVHMRTALLCGAAVLLVAGLVAYLRLHVCSDYQILSSVEISDDSATQYIRLKGRTLKCSPNGVTCVNNANDVQWNVTFTMQSLLTDVCGSTAVVADCRGKDIYVFNKDGQMGHFQSEYTLLKVRVTQQGVVAAVLEDGETTWINVYDAQGNLLVKDKTSMKESGYPVDVDLSSDGKKMAVSYLGIDSSDVKTTVAFYNFSSAGKDEENNMVNSEEFAGTVVPQVAFMDDNSVVVFRDDGLSFFGGRNVPEKKKDITIDTEIISAFYNDKYVGIVTQSDEEEQTHKYKMQIFRAGGSKCSTVYFDFDYTDVSLYDDEVVMYNAGAIAVYSVNGRRTAGVQYEKQIVDVIKIGSRYEVVTSDSVDRIKLK